MDNKNEKTFADLFMNSQDSEKVEDNKVTFDILSDNVEDIVESSSENNTFSFSDFNNISNEKINDDIDADNNLEIAKSNKEAVNVFNIASNMIEHDDASLDDDKVKENSNATFSNIFSSDINDLNSVKVEAVDSIEGNSVQENLASNLFDLGEQIDVKDEDKPDLEEKVEEVVEPKEESSGNVFGLGEQPEDKEEVKLDLKEKVEEVVEPKEEALGNVFGLGEQPEDKEEVKLDLEEKVEEVVEPKEEESGNVSSLGDTNEIEESSQVDKDSELFNNNEFVIESPLFSNNISLDETDKTKKDLGKVDLNHTKHFQVKIVPKKEPLIKFIFGVISYAFFIWLLLIGITLLVYVLDIKIRASKGDYSAPTFNAYVVLTGSMLPEIQVNDVVITKKVEAEDLDVGDIITFASTDSRFAGTIITHRIIKKNPGVDGGGITFQTKGDNNNVADSALVPAANIYGKVILKIPKLGYLQEFLAAEGGWIIVILIPCLTVISYDIVKIVKGLKRKKYNNIKVKK